MPVDPTYFDIFRSLSGERAIDWQPPVMQFVREGQDGVSIVPSGDVPWLSSGTMVFKERAFWACRDLLEPWGEFLELRVEGDAERLWYFNVLNIVDALDEAKSAITYFADGTRIMMIHRWAFNGNVPRGPAAFRVPKVTELLFTDALVSRLEALHLSGAHFKQLWSGDETG